MLGLQIQKGREGLLASISALCAAVAIGAGIWIGPRGIYLASGLGLVVAFAAIVAALRAPSLEKPYIFPSIAAAVHVVFLITGLVLQGLFLSPLPKESLKMPRLQVPYKDADGLFTLLGPSGWTYRSAPGAYESGVRMQPSDQSRYMGVSEVTVFVRRLDTEPTSDEEFLEKAATAFSGKRPKSAMFEISTERSRSLSGASVVWSNLTVKRFWVPVYQVSVFGIKEKRYLCSVSATGLKSHSALSKILCVGLFERVKIVNPR